MNQTTSHRSGTGAWWDSRLFGRWILVNSLAYVVIVIGGVLLEDLASSVARDLADNYRWLAIAVVAIIGAGFHGTILGRWQWRILHERLSNLRRRKWVTATFVPSLIVWLFAIAPQAVDTLTEGGDTLSAFKNGFIQALVLGPLIGLSQAAALRSDTTRWAWWFAANVTTYLTGAVMYRVGGWLLEELSLTGDMTAAFPLLAFAIHGTWMLWVTAPEAATPGSNAPSR